jgi:hypothetical protein
MTEANTAFSVPFSFAFLGDSERNPDFFANPTTSVMSQ